MTARAESRAARDPGSALRARGRTILVVALLVVAAAGVAPAAAQEETVDCSFPVTLTDATGTAVTVEEEPQRVVVLAPSAAQTMWAIGAEETVVGMPVNRFTAYLNGSEERTNVVDERGQPIAEAVVGTEPDLVLAPNIIGEEAIGSLRDAGLTVYKFRIANVREPLAGRERPSVYYPLGGGFTAGPGTFVGDVLASAGGDNVATRANISAYARISQEVLAATTIDWIVTTGDSPLPNNDAINESRAVARDQIVRVNANFLNQPGPRVVGPLGEIASALHPEAMDGVDLGSVTAEPSVSCADAASPATTTGPGEATTTDDGEATTTTVATDDGEATTTPVATDDGEATTTTASGDGPGFTLAGAVVALLAATLLAARRRSG